MPWPLIAAVITLIAIWVLQVYRTPPLGAWAAAWDTGDIVLVASTSPVAWPIYLAQRLSPWTHCGMVIKEGGTLYVVESTVHAKQHGVSMTPLDRWFAEGVYGPVAYRRFVGPPEERARMGARAKAFLGLPYQTPALRPHAPALGGVWCSWLVAAAAALPRARNVVPADLARVGPWGSLRRVTSEDVERA